MATGERSQRTLDVYRQRYRTHIEPAIGRRRLQDVRAEHIGAIYSRQRNAGLSSWTIRGTDTVLSAMFTFALTRGYVAANPLHRLAKIERPRQVAKRDPRRLTDDEIRRLCTAATPTYKAIITTLAWTGIRVSEALGLRWQDVDFEQRQLHVRHQLDDRGNLKKPKTKAGNRTVPMLPVLERALREHRERQFSLGLAGEDRPLFTTLTGKPLDRHNVRSRGVVAAAQKAGLNTGDVPTVTTHDLRRTFISHLIVRLGLDPVRVARIAGHASVTQTLNTYAEEFDKAMHRDDLLGRITAAGFGALEPARTVKQ